jgi:transposase
MARFDLTDFEWSVIQPLLPTKVRGVKRRDDPLPAGDACIAERGRFSTASFGGSGLVRPGPIFRPATGRIRRV